MSLGQCANRKSGSLITKSPVQIRESRTLHDWPGVAPSNSECMYLCTCTLHTRPFLLFTLSFETPINNTEYGVDSLTAIGQEISPHKNNYTPAQIHLPRGMRLEMRQSTSATAKWLALIIKKPNYYKVNIAY